MGRVRGGDGGRVLGFNSDGKDEDIGWFILSDELFDDDVELIV